MLYDTADDDDADEDGDDDDLNNQISVRGSSNWARARNIDFLPGALSPSRTL